MLWSNTHKVVLDYHASMPINHEYYNKIQEIESTRAHAVNVSFPIMISFHSHSVEAAYIRSSRAHFSRPASKKSLSSFIQFHNEWMACLFDNFFRTNWVCCFLFGFLAWKKLLGNARWCLRHEKVIFIHKNNWTENWDINIEITIILITVFAANHSNWKSGRKSYRRSVNFN